MRILFVWFIALLSFADAQAEAVPPACASMVAAIGAPTVIGRDHVILCRLGYVLSHDNEYKTPNWVVEHLTPDRFVGPADRTALGNPFRADPDLKADDKPYADLPDYKSKFQGRSFDRGHMAPAASMKFSEDAMRQSFYLSNMAPQQGIGLNRHIWADLESIVRDWTCEREELYVITGPIYDKDVPDLLGPGEVAIPTAFYKIAYDPGQRHLIAFILPNEKVDKNGQNAWDVLKSYIVSLRTVEERANLTLMENLQPREKRRLSNMLSVMWPVEKPCRAVQ